MCVCVGVIVCLLCHFYVTSKGSRYQCINRGDRYRRTADNREKRTVSSREVSFCLSLSQCAGTEIALRSLYSSACEPCVLLRSLAEASVHWSVQLRGLRALTKLPLPGLGELEATVPDASCFHCEMQCHSSRDSLSM